jgi:hypothetical protein
MMKVETNQSSSRPRSSTTLSAPIYRLLGRTGGPGMFAIADVLGTLHANWLMALRKRTKNPLSDYVLHPPMLLGWPGRSGSIKPS